MELLFFNGHLGHKRKTVHGNGPPATPDYVLEDEALRLVVARTETLAIG